MGGALCFEEKIKSRYYWVLDLIPELVKLCDIVHIYVMQQEKLMIKFQNQKFHVNKIK